MTKTRRKIVLKGRLLNANSNEYKRCCRLYLADESYVSCIFDAEIAPKMQKAVGRYVRLWGTAEMDGTTRKIRPLKVQGVTILAGTDDAPETVSDPAEIVDETVAYADPDELEEISNYLSVKNFDLYRRLAQ